MFEYFAYKRYNTNRALTPAHFNFFGKSSVSILSLKILEKYWENISLSLNVSLLCAAPTTHPSSLKTPRTWKNGRRTNFWNSIFKTTNTSVNPRERPIPLNRFDCYYYCIPWHVNSFFGFKKVAGVKFCCSNN